ncbi:protein NATD1-like [Heterodontus francisci]|uniref:protein NATD1-like n=1 Tax=Heterodontus francisci TaxID=7792 RepID=UPI00355B4E14
MSRKFVANLLKLKYPAGSSMSTSGNFTVRHDRQRQQFSVSLGGSTEEAVLRYSYIGNKMIDLNSTTVPSDFRGQGIGQQLAQAAMNFVVQEDLKARISCWFIKKFVNDNPQYRDRIVN